MIEPMRMLLLLVPAALLAAASPRAQLRHAVAGADVVVVAAHVGRETLDREWIVHRLRVRLALRGAVPDVISVVEPRRLGVHARPRADAPRLYCLHRFDERARRAGLPDRLGPYFKMNGHEGADPVVRDPERSPHVRLARLVLASLGGRPAKELAGEVLDLVFAGPLDVRTEAVGMIVENPVLRSALGPLDWSRLVSRAVGETEDVSFKIALARLCAEQRIPGLVASLSLAVDQVPDRRFALALGRIARTLHGEDATRVLRGQMARARTRTARGALMLAIGATSTESGLEELLRLRALARAEDRAPIDAALAVHGSARARAVLGK